MTFTNGNLKLAIQKEGRLTDETVAFLRATGLEFENANQRLFSSCRNFPLEILYLRDDDIPNYVASGTVDIGIVGQNLLYEKREIVKKLLNLRFGFCSLVIAVPKETTIQSYSDLQNKKIATSYLTSTKNFLKKNRINATLIPIRGSVEIAPSLGIADAIVDLTSTGSTLSLQDLKVIEKIYDSEAVLISNSTALNDQKKSLLIKKILLRFSGVLSAKQYKYIMMNAPKDILPKIKRITPGLKSPTIAPLAKEGWISIQTVIKEDIFWETIERVKALGASGIIVLPIEKMIT